MNYEIHILKKTGKFAENKDIAQDLRLNKILPKLKEGKSITIDFKGVEMTTQSFVHALLSDIIRKKGPQALDHIAFRNCNPAIRAIIEIVIDYMQRIGDALQ